MFSHDIRGCIQACFPGKTIVEVSVRAPDEERAILYRVSGITEPVYSAQKID